MQWVRWLALVFGLMGCTALEPYPGIVPEQCTNGVDDDLNGLVDLADEACAVLGTSCTQDASACTSHGLVCNAAHRCAASCDARHACTAGWSCVASVCECSPCTERCNGLDDDCDGRLDESTCAVGERCDGASATCSCEGTTYYLPDSQLDLLFVMQNSASLNAVRTSLTMSLADAVRGLATGDLDDDGVREAAPIDSLHLGMVVTDIGVDAENVPGCAPGLGLDGVLGAGTSCPTMPVFDFESLRDVPATFAHDATCALTTVGTQGCGITQSLETTLKALAPSAPTSWTRAGYVAPTFRGNTSGHGDGSNAAFVRDGSTLAIVLVTNHDDMSAPDARLWDPLADPAVPIGARAVAHPELLHPIARYVDGLLSLRPDPSRVVFAAITGIPTDAGGMSPSTILARPDMLPRIDPMPMPNAIVSVCSSVDAAGNHIDAAPAQRIVQVAEGLSCGGASTVVESICALSLQDAFRAILRAVATQPQRRVCVRTMP